MTNIKVLIACEFSGIVREAFRTLGHDAWSCDLEPTEIPGQHIQDDVLKHLDEGWDLMIAHPPCTYLTVSGNRWFKPEYKDRYPTREQDRKDAIAFFMALINAPIPKIAVENPIGIMSRVYCKPTQIIHPWQFGHTSEKTTCLWLKNLPLLIPTNIVTPEFVQMKNGQRMNKFHYESFYLPKNERSKTRSRTFTGIAHAMAQQWGTSTNHGLTKYFAPTKLPKEKE